VTAAARTFGLDLPDYPWEAMAPYLARAAQHPGGAANLSIGTPVDATPEVVQEALRAAANAPGYPTVHGTAGLREAIAAWFARRRGVPGLDPQDIMPTVGSKELGAVVASDECYAELGWGEWDVQRGGTPVPSILDPRVAEGSHEGLLAVYSLSKQSNLAGYRAAFVAGDPAIMANLVNSRKHAGMIVPYPVQEAMRVALGDDAHVQVQKDLYRGRRERIVPALERFGLTIHESRAGLYLWATADEATWDTVGRLADRGIVVGPGVFYGDAGNGFVRVALTASDERIDAAASRLATGP
jgi:aspartate/methionine/tyrosine aminotransferase